MLTKGYVYKIVFSKWMHYFQIGSIPPVKYWKKKRLYDTHSELNDLKFNDSRSASPTTESAKQPETVEEKEVEQNLTAEEKEVCFLYCRQRHKIFE